MSSGVKFRTEVSTKHLKMFSDSHTQSYLLAVVVQVCPATIVRLRGVHVDIAASVLASAMKDVVPIHSFEGSQDQRGSLDVDEVWSIGKTEWTPGKCRAAVRLKLGSGWCLMCGRLLGLRGKQA